MADDPFYVIDSSSLIDMKLYYRMSSFKTLWVRINDLIRQGRLAAPMAVLEELEYKSDELTAWAQEHNESFFYSDSEYSLGQVSRILKQFPNLINPNREREQAILLLLHWLLTEGTGLNKLLIGSTFALLQKKGLIHTVVEKPKKQRFLKCAISLKFPVFQWLK